MHKLELRGDLVGLLKAALPTEVVGIMSNESLLILVAGARFGHCFQELHQARICR